jgi:protein-disulfide isomerase
MTRRDFIAATSSLALAAALSKVAGFDVVSPALAEDSPTVSMMELMAPGPLPDQVLGKADAPVTIVEYASMTCSHCAHFSTTTFPEIKKRYIDTGKVRFILREFPLDPLAAGAFMLARCAGEGKYYPMVETLFQQQNTWAVQKPIEPLFALAKQAGFTKDTFDACLKDQKMLDGIEAIRSRGEKFGVNSTPSFFINGKMFRGALSVQDMAQAIDPLLKGA